MRPFLRFKKSNNVEKTRQSLLLKGLLIVC